MPGFGGCGVGGQAGAPGQQAGHKKQSKSRCREESEKRHDGVSADLLAHYKWASKTAEENPQGADTGDGGGREEVGREVAHLAVVRRCHHCWYCFRCSGARAQ